MYQCISSIIIFLDCSELADHVVHRAKVRLKKRQRRNLPSLKATPHGLQPTATSSPSSSPSKPKPAAMLRKQANNITTGSQPHSNLKAQTALLSKRTDVVSRSTTISSLGRQLEMMEGVNSSSSSPTLHVVTRSLKVVYWSDRQSVTPKNTGIPNVPPVTPSTRKLEVLRVIFTG